MHTPLRAGLLAVVLFLVVVFASAAPLATTRTRVDASFHSPLGHGHPSSNLGQTRLSSVIRIEKESTFSLHDVHDSSRHAQIHLEFTNEGVSPILEREVLTRRSKISEHFKVREPAFHFDRRRFVYLARRDLEKRSGSTSGYVP